MRLAISYYKKYFNETYCVKVQNFAVNNMHTASDLRLRFLCIDRALWVSQIVWKINVGQVT